MYQDSLLILIIKGFQTLILKILRKSLPYLLIQQQCQFAQPNIYTDTISFILEHVQVSLPQIPHSCQIQSRWVNILVYNDGSLFLHCI